MEKILTIDFAKIKLFSNQKLSIYVPSLLKNLT